MTLIQKHLINNMLERISQDEKFFPNKALFRAMRLLNFPADRIRKAIIAANDIKLQQLVADQVSLTSLYTALNAKAEAKSTVKARQAISRAVGIDPALFWQEDDIEDIAA